MSSASSSSATDILDVLVVARPDDEHAAVVLRHLTEGGYRAGRTSLCELRDITLVWRPGDTLEISGVGRVGTHTTVWWRRPGTVDVTGLLPEEALLVHREVEALFEEALTSTPVRWVDPPAVIDLAERKLHQLTVALRLGVATPETIVTNSREEAEQLRSRGLIVAKPVSSGPGLAPMVRLVPRDLLDSVRRSPTLLQQAVSAVADLRVVTIGESAFVWRRPRQPNAPVDWREADPGGRAFQYYPDAKEAEASALRMARALDLTFSVQDWLELTDRLVFLEVNPQGAWLFLQDAEGITIPPLVRHLTASMATEGRWPHPLRQLWWDLLPARVAPPRGGVVGPVPENPAWLAESAASLPEVLEHARRARQEAEHRAQGAEDKGSRLVTLSLALVGVTLTVAANLVGDSLVFWPPTLHTLSLGASALAIVFFLVAGVEAFAVDQVGMYFHPDASEPARSGDAIRTMVALEERGRFTAAWTGRMKLNTLLQARAWFSRGVVALLVAVVLFIVDAALPPQEGAATWR